MNALPVELEMVAAASLTLVDLLRQRAEQQPDQVAFTFLKDGETKTAGLTYRRLDRQAQTIAAWLQAQQLSGQRVLLIYPYDAGLEFIAAFLGCLYAGVVAVSGHPPRNRSGVMEVQTRLQDAEAAAIFTTQSLLPKLQSQLAEFQPTCRWCATDQLATATFQPLPISSESLAFLQYTSGSTGAPKGVMITHASLMQNQRLLQLAFGHTAASVGVGWLPLFHDMGLIGIVLQTLYMGATSVLMSPIDFVQKPVRWLQAVSRYQATTSGGPNFAYDLLCRKVTPEQMAQLDLSRWEVAFTGAEPVRAETLERFSQTFAPCGFRQEAFYPCYGMAEATLFITGGHKLTPPRALTVESVALEQNRVVPANSSDLGRTLVSCGQGWLDTEIRIVDPQSGQPCAADQIGEIWVASSGLGQGYWQQPQLTEQTFQAQLADQPQHRYLRTGDLGFLHQGELFITGRLHDVLVFWGFNHYPQQIEQTVSQCHPGFRADGTAAFSAPIAGSEYLVIAQEVERNYRDKLQIDEVIELIRWRVFEEHFVDVRGIVLLKPGGLPKTSSGKVRRSACQQQFLANQLDAIGQWQQASDIPSDPNAVMDRYLSLSAHLRRYRQLSTGKLQRWLTAFRVEERGVGG